MRSPPDLLKRHFFLFAAVGLVALMVLAGALRLALADGGEGGGGPGPAGREQAVTAAAVVSRPFADRIEALGVAKGRRSLDIASPTTELITRVFFRDGQAVRAGAPLFELRAGEEDAGILQARANLAQAERDWRRWTELAERGIAPRVQAEQAETAYRAAQAIVAAAEARRGDRLIRAPFSGVVGLSDVTAGTLVNPGAVIATLDDTSVIRVDFPVPERYLGALRPGLPITATVDALPGDSFSGSIALLDTRVNEQTRAITARAELPNPGGRLRPGMLVRVRIEQGRREAPAAPEAAVQFEGDGAFVYRIAAQGEGAVAQRVAVETGAVEGGYIEIVSGLQPTDRIVADGLNRIQPGARVRVAGAARAAAAPAPAAAS